MPFKITYLRNHRNYLFLNQLKEKAKANSKPALVNSHAGGAQGTASRQTSPVHEE